MNPEPKSLWQTAAACVVLVVATLGAYWPVFHCGFISFDDPDYVTNNFMVQLGISLKGLAWAFSTQHAANWHPLTWLSHMLDCQLFGLNPAGHHAINLLLHIANSLLVLLLLKRITGALWRSAFVAALFALHPLHVESVAWISERKDVLSTFFGLLAIWAYSSYVKAANKKQNAESGIRQAASRFMFHASCYYMLSLLLFACSLMSKPMLVTLPFVLLLLDYWPLRRWQVVSGKWRVTGQDSEAQRSMFDVRGSTFARLLFEKLPFLALSLTSSVVTVLAQHGWGALSQPTATLMGSRFANASVSYVRYIGKVLWPHDLAVWYPPVSWEYWQVSGAVLIILTVTLFGLLAAHRRPYLIVGWLWFVGTLVPVIGIIQVGSQSMADRYAYVPSLGFFVILCWGLGEFGRLRHAVRLVLVLTGAGALLALVWLSQRQVRYWHDSITLFQHTLVVTKHNELAHDRLGESLLQQRRLGEAKAHWYSALKLAPRLAEAHYGLGLALQAEGQPAETIAHWRTALQLKPEWFALMNNFAWLLATCPDAVCRNPAEAVRLAEQASAAAQRNFNFFDTLGAAYAAAGRFPDAVAAAQQAVVLAEAAGQTNVAARFRSRLELYQNQKPYRTE